MEGPFFRISQKNHDHPSIKCFWQAFLTTQVVFFTSFQRFPSWKATSPGRFKPMTPSAAGWLSSWGEFLTCEGLGGELGLGALPPKLRGSGAPESFFLVFFLVFLGQIEGGVG